jgi:hypothetical protein
MRSDEARSASGRSEQRGQVQGSLEGILPETPAAPQEDLQREPTDAGKSTMKKRTNRPRTSDEGTGPDALRASLDALEENITLLLARHESIAAAHADDERRRRTEGTLDAVELDKRVRALEAEKERLERHAAFLEDRIRGLLSRVRYVIES